ncbi:hypothetical protein SAMN05216388_103824 [Halorientalis persicus]|uniref:Uncharacterized protein n=1 Tax=Halorientalis persicus TaxID=1367881 RepID=A0A1H8VJM8_9EURY|nr:DUF6338 family protein [Halorientalis persicus]SEP15427.1 hypothetical protein SAMN05216388_103824 [Halorientalis persicus]
MQPFSPENLLIGLFLLVPGFIAAYIAISIAVVEKQIPKSEFIILCLVLSGIIDTIFLTVVGLLGHQITRPEGIESVFFSTRFHPEYVVILGIITIVVGAVLSWILIFDIPELIRGRMWGDKEIRRNPWQPWEGVLKKATQDRSVAQVLTSDDELVKGQVVEYSRAENPKEVYLYDPLWFDEHIGDWVEGGTGVLLLEEDIVRLEIVEAPKRPKEDE